MLDALEKQQTNFKLLSVEELAAVTDRELQAGLPTGFVAETQVIYRKIKSERGRATYVEIYEPTLNVNGNYASIWDFVRNVAVNGYDPNWDDDAEATALGIRVSHPSFIVLEIHEETDWTFSETYPAVQLQEPVPYPDRYGYLHYVRPDGTTSPRPIAGCRIVFFAAMPQFGIKPNFYIQKMNYYVTDGNGVGQIIDPDVRHPGNGNS